MVVMKSLQHRTLSAATAEELRRRILAGLLPAGTALRQDALAEEFGISRIPLREAFLQLEAQGLVRILPHRGAVVSELSAEDYEEIFELRLILEPRLLRRSAPRLDAADYRRLRATLADYERALRERDVGRWGELNTAFHLQLYGQADQPRSLAVVTGLLQESDRLTRIQLAGSQELDRAQAEHTQLIDLCEAGRTTEALTALRRHIDHVRRALRALSRER
jgi:DNA-binding GntR family transcriptional regulator